MIKRQHIKPYERNMCSKKVEHSTSAGLYCTMNDVKVPFCIPELSIIKIISFKNNGVMDGVTDCDSDEYSSHALANPVDQVNSNALSLVRKCENLLRQRRTPSCAAPNAIYLFPGGR